MHWSRRLRPRSPRETSSITAGGSYAQADITALKNAISEVATILNQLNKAKPTAIAIALATLDNSGGASAARLLVEVI
jgi:hypothetical protein